MGERSLTEVAEGLELGVGVVDASDERVLVGWTAECSEMASVNCSGSLAKRMICGMTPQVETVR